MNFLSPGMMLTDFITKTPDGEVPGIKSDETFKNIFNNLGYKPETVAVTMFVNLIIRRVLS